MKNILIIFLFTVLLSSCQEKITIVRSDTADSIEEFASEELNKYLSLIYPDCRFIVSTKPGKRKSIYIKQDVETAGVPDSDDGYLIKSDEGNSFILSRGSTGLVYGVYGILEALGCGFYLSDEFLPNPIKKFDFEAWELSNSPLVKERYVFNWHNFISGCTGWDKEHWLEWIDRSQKMGYNTVMVHAYHNNPMYTYDFNGETKEVGFINTSGKGRDWGNIPINDVRRLPGGDIYENAEFGSEIALVPDDKRVEMAQKTMAEVFSYALNRGVQVCMAIDIDMPISFLQNTLLKELPEEDKFYASGPAIWIPDPGKPQGYEFYKSQLEGLLEIYPMLEKISLFRRGATFFRDVSLDELPEGWQKEYKQYVDSFPYLKDLEQKQVIGSFITSKLVMGYKDILQDFGRNDIELSTGSWAGSFVLPTATFLPDEIKLMPIDWDVRIDNPMMDDPDLIADFSNPQCQNRVIPFIWAHHDDGEYLGRPYAPTIDLKDKLDTAKCESFGVFHWMNRPLDLFFKGMIRQVWANTENESVDETCKLMAGHYFGSRDKHVYFEDWLSQAPMFGRATLMNFFHRPMNEAVYDFDKAIAECNKRIELLESFEDESMIIKQKSYLEYFKTLEQFIIDFSKTQAHLLKAEEYLDKDDFVKAQEELMRGDPALPVRTFSRLGKIAKEERGEIAFTQRMAVKYIPDYISFEQRARLKPFRVNIDSLVYEDLAQGNANITYHIDPDGNFWESLGKRELSTDVKGFEGHRESMDALEPYKEILKFGAKIDPQVNIPIRPVMRAGGVKNNDVVTKGKYLLKLLLTSDSQKPSSINVDIGAQNFTLSVEGTEQINLNIDHPETGTMDLSLKLLSGDAYVCGLEMLPLEN